MPLRGHDDLDWDDTEDYGPEVEPNLLCASVSLWSDFPSCRNASHARLMRAGVPVAFSSDLPVSADPNPWPGIQVAVDDQVNGITLPAALSPFFTHRSIDQ